MSFEAPGLEKNLAGLGLADKGQYKVKVVKDFEESQCWLGGSVWASCSMNDPCFFTKEQYDGYGPSIVKHYQ